ncbi:MAG: ABC transporter ATP-binding protein [Actinobacteria bacterium]|nr:ABC transporter ATP-binding protein [Actinomycetota bacterium]MBU1493107.1 ABC transporter ATP-binding protein [Actinomycetota bacterium]MBU1865981.1 ABC transporter ATP-binding protein [Actinomycetota bacterium]
MGDDVRTPILIAEGVVAGYLPGVDILQGVDLELDRGELVGIIGPNGAGKSTLVKAMFGLVEVRAGRVTLEGEDITSRAAHELVAMGVGYVPQLANVFQTLTVEDNLRMGLYLRPGAWEARYAEITDLFPLLAERSGQRAGLLSGGERQMLAMGRALMMDPSVLLLDEPSAGLSPANQDMVFETVRRVADYGVSTVMVEQNARRCLLICDRGYVLDQGRNAYSGSGADLLHDPKVIDLYLGTLGRTE